MKNLTIAETILRDAAAKLSQQVIEALPAEYNLYKAMDASKLTELAKEIKIIFDRQELIEKENKELNNERFYSSSNHDGNYGHSNRCTGRNNNYL